METIIGAFYCASRLPDTDNNANGFAELFLSLVLSLLWKGIYIYFIYNHWAYKNLARLAKSQLKSELGLCFNGNLLDIE